MSLTSDIEGSWQDSPDHSLLHSGIDTGNEELTSGVLDGPSPAHAPSSHTLSCRHVAHRGGDCSPLSFISFAGIGRQFFFSSEVSEMWNRFYFYCPLISLFLFFWGGVAFAEVQSTTVTPPQLVSWVAAPVSPSLQLASLVQTLELEQEPV